MELPEEDELVLATIRKIMPYGAFCSLDEYGVEAFVHISEVAPRWIKNIHEFLHEGQKVVAKVHRIIKEKNQIDISLKRVTESERKRKLESVRREKREEKLFSIITTQAKMTSDEADGIRKVFEGKYGSLYDGLERIAQKGEEEIKGDEFGRFGAVILEVAQKNIKKVKVQVGGVLMIKCYGKEGVDAIKAALSTIVDMAGMEVAYVGAPRYKISVTADNYKNAEKRIKEAVDKVDCEMKGKNGVVSFERE
jgi:translation initiation factor 2 subunit 1